MYRVFHKTNALTSRLKRRLEVAEHAARAFTGWVERIENLVIPAAARSASKRLRRPGGQISPSRSRYGSSHLARFGRISTKRHEAVLLDSAGTSMSLSLR